MRKIMYTPVNPSYTKQKWGLRGSKLYRSGFVMRKVMQNVFFFFFYIYIIQCNSFESSNDSVNRLIRLCICASRYRSGLLLIFCIIFVRRFEMTSVVACGLKKDVACRKKLLGMRKFGVDFVLCCS